MQRILKIDVHLWGALERSGTCQNLRLWFVSMCVFAAIAPPAVRLIAGERAAEYFCVADAGGRGPGTASRATHAGYSMRETSSTRPVGYYAPSAASEKARSCTLQARKFNPSVRIFRELFFLFDADGHAEK